MSSAINVALSLGLAFSLTVAAAGPRPAYPNRRLTPGSVLRVTAADVCRPGYAKSVRHVTAATRRQVLASYGYDDGPHGAEFELDHLISLELGGSNAASNLWPEPYAGTGARVKDKVENYLHREVCQGRMTLQEAQREIATDWYAVYVRMGR